MDADAFTSSDSVRGGEPLRHAQSVTFDGPVALELGGELPGVTIVYETYGQLSAARDNAVLICHAVSGDSHVARHDEQDEPGWWDLAGMVGPGRPIDTDRYFVVCPNLLGGCRGTTGPNSTDPRTGRCYGRDFPTLTIGDMAQAQGRLIDRLGIDVLLAVIGGSMGGQLVLDWATRRADRVRGAVPIATAPRLTSQALAFDIVGRNAIVRDPSFLDGQYCGTGVAPTAGLAIARMLGHITYLSRQAMQEKFDGDRFEPRDVAAAFESRFSVGSYLAYQGAKFVDRFDANSYVTLSTAMDLFDLGGTPEALAALFAGGGARWLVLSFTSDWLFPPEQSRQIVDALIAGNVPVSYCNVASRCGHDAFLLPDDAAVYGELIRAFLAGLSGRPREEVSNPVTSGEVSNPVTAGLEPRLEPQPEAARDGVLHSPTSIFHPDHPQRLDYRRILELIPRGASVLDLGCGDGGLLAELKRRGHARIVGLEIGEDAIITCVRRGLDVVQADLNDGLAQFADEQFDFVLLSQTLQAILDVERILADMVRVGRQCVVSFPNFAYRKLRRMLCEQGRAPEAEGLLRHKWYNTPNRRFFSIADFEDLCREKAIRVLRRITLDTEAGGEVSDEPNLNADLAIFVISR